MPDASTEIPVRPVTNPAAAGNRTSELAAAEPLPRWLTAGPALGPPRAEAVEALPTVGVIALNRMGFGPRPGDLAAFDALGVDDDARLAAYVAQQLDPDPNQANDTEYNQRRLGLAGYPNPNFVTLDLSLASLWSQYVSPGGSSPSSRPVEEVRLDTLLRMVYSKWQLREVLADFWHNHFNVYGFEFYAQQTMSSYDRDVIRTHLFGNFREFLEAVAKHTAMLYYLDNYTNTRNGPNENYGRELFELHTLGAENYYGVGGQGGVPHWPGDPVWPTGTPSAGQFIPAGYVDNDVYEASRAFTGWGVSSAGVYAYTAANHDNFQKALLSFGDVNIPPNQLDEKDGKDVFDMLAAHPGTGRYVARKLCRRLIADDPPAALVDSVGALFTAQWQAPDQLKQVVEAILLSAEFKSTWGAKIKRPIEMTVSAMRAGSPNWLFGYSTPGNPPTVEADTSSLLSRQSRTGHNLFARVPPDGHPDVEGAWSGTNTRLQCWRLAAWLVDQDIDGNGATDDFRLDLLGAVYAAFPTHQVSPNQLVDFWIPRVFGRSLDADQRNELVVFMAQGGNPASALNLDASSTVRSRVRSLVALMFMMPEFVLK
jgi:uncharacterized protein (DUF1800 family)